MIDHDDVVLRVAGLRKSYGENEVVRGLDFEIRRGECFGLLGPNGAGKTTTLRCCLGLIEPDGGTIEMVGLPVPQAARKARIRVGVVPQLDNLDPDFTVTENLQIYGRYFGLHRGRSRRPDPEAARIRGSREQGRCRNPDAVGRHETAPHTRPRPGQRSRAPDPRRADDRARPAGAASDLGRTAPAPLAGQDDPADHPLHGRGRAPLLAPRGHRPRER